MIEEKVYQPQQDNVELMKLYNQEVRELPGIPDRETLLLRARLIFEEAMEFVKAAGCAVIIGDNKEGTIHDRLEVVDIGTKPDLIEMADAIGDTLVVTYGAANALGIQVKPVWDEIQRSNLSKTWPDGTIHKREDGKVVKPPTYSPADIETVLLKQVLQVPDEVED